MLCRSKLRMGISETIMYKI